MVAIVCIENFIRLFNTITSSLIQFFISEPFQPPAQPPGTMPRNVPQGILTTDRTALKQAFDHRVETRCSIHAACDMFGVKRTTLVVSLCNYLYSLGYQSLPQIARHSQ